VWYYVIGGVRVSPLRGESSKGHDLSEGDFSGSSLSEISLVPDEEDDDEEGGDGDGDGDTYSASTGSTALLRVGSAVQHLLLGQDGEFSVSEGPVALNGLGSREGPAGAAITLVLDVGDDVLFSPIDRVWKVLDWASESLGDWSRDLFLLMSNEEVDKDWR